jgi:hypothetical protein
MLAPAQLSIHFLGVHSMHGQNPLGRQVFNKRDQDKCIVAAFKESLVLFQSCTTLSRSSHGYLVFNLTTRIGVMTIIFYFPHAFPLPIPLARAQSIAIFQCIGQYNVFQIAVCFLPWTRTTSSKVPI